MIPKEYIFIEDMSNGYVNLFKSGAFYRCYEYSAMYINDLMWYKFTLAFSSANKVVLQVWFPLKSLEDVVSLLKQNNINHRIIDSKDYTWEYMDTGTNIDIDKEKQ